MLILYIVDALNPADQSEIYIPFSHQAMVDFSHGTPLNVNHTIGVQLVNGSSKFQDAA